MINKKFTNSMSENEYSAYEDGYIQGLKKAAKISQQYFYLPLKNDAYKCGCREIEASILATIHRIVNNEEFEDSTSSVM